MNLLINEPPLQVLPSLAKKLNSVDKAIMLQQIHYWSSKSNNKKNGYRWVYNTIEEWHDQFPWLSKKTVQRYLKQLEDDGYLITGSYNKLKFDRTKWYRINYDKMTSPMGLTVPTKGTINPHDGDPQSLSEWDYQSPSEGDSQSTPIPETTRDYSKTTSETTNKRPPKAPQGAGKTTDANSQKRQQIINYLNQQLGTAYKPNAAKNKTVINARLKEGYTFSDFKKVVDTKLAEWGNDSRMSKFLRPETLFGSKMEGYLNERPATQPMMKGMYDRHYE